MNFDISNRIICAAVIVLLGVFGGDGCALKPGAHLLPAANSVPGKSAPVLRVISGDSAARGILCESLARTGAFARIHCGGDDPADLELLVDTAVVNSSDDYSRNAGWSVLTLTTALTVSTSAQANFRFRMGPPGGPYSEVKYAARGRIGMWSYLPVYTGFIATTLGTWLNEYRLPEKLRVRCLGAADSSAKPIGATEPGNETSSACREYREFLRDAYSKVRLDFWSALRHAAFKISPESRRRAAPALGFRNIPARCAKPGRESQSCPY